MTHKVTEELAGNDGNYGCEVDQSKADCAKPVPSFRDWRHEVGDQSSVESDTPHVRNTVVEDWTRCQFLRELQ